MLTQIYVAIYGIIALGHRELNQMLFNALRPSDTYMCRQPSLFGAKPLSEPVLEYCYLDP